MKFHSKFISVEKEVKLRASSAEFFRKKDKARAMVEKAIQRWNIDRLENTFVTWKQHFVFHSVRRQRAALEQFNQNSQGEAKSKDELLKY